MTYEEIKKLLDQYSIGDLKYLHRMIDESISAKFTHNYYKKMVSESISAKFAYNYYKKMVKDFSINNKVGDCFLYKYPNSNTLSLQFITNICECNVETIRYDIDFDNNDIYRYECELKLHEVNKYKKSNIKECDIKKIYDDVDFSINNIYKAAKFDIIHLIEKSDDI